MTTTTPTAADDLVCELEALRTITSSLLMLAKVEGLRLVDARPMLEKLDTLPSSPSSTRKNALQ